GGLTVGTRMVPQPSVPTSPPVDPVPKPIYYPSVTQLVYADVYPYHAEFVIETSDAVNIYYAAMYELSDAPDAQALKDAALSEFNEEGMKGTASVSKGLATIKVTQLAESENFVLYVAAEAPDGKLSEVYKHPFVTD